MTTQQEITLPRIDHKTSEPNKARPSGLGAQSILLLHFFREARLLERKRRAELMASAPRRLGSTALI